MDGVDLRAKADSSFRQVAEYVEEVAETLSKSVMSPLKSRRWKIAKFSAGAFFVSFRKKEIQLSSFGVGFDLICPCAIVQAIDHFRKLLRGKLCDRVFDFYCG